MRLDFHANPVDEPEIRAGIIGCGSHACRNVYPALQFAPVKLVSVCSLNEQQAQLVGRKFGAERHHTDYRKMLEEEELDAVFVVTGYDSNGRPTYPPIVEDCLNRGKHVWLEKPPALRSSEIEGMRAAAKKNGKNVVVGFKKIFCPANEQAKHLMEAEEFGDPVMVMLEYPQSIPEAEELRAYLEGEKNGAQSFLDHLFHPVSLLLYLAGNPDSMYYERSRNGAGMVTFGYESGLVATLALTAGASGNGGMERTMIIGTGTGHITVENNIRLTLHRSPPLRYGAAGSYFTGEPSDASAVWEPDFSLGTLYNKALFVQGFYGEVNEFARSILDGRAPTKGTLDEALAGSMIFEAFAEGPGKKIRLAMAP